MSNEDMAGAEAAASYGLSEVAESIEIGAVPYDRLLAGPQFPIHRWGLPQDVADAVSIFTSGKLAYSTGEVLHVDGGYMNIRSI